MFFSETIEDEEMSPEEESQPKYSPEYSPSSPSTFEQLGQAIKFIGTFVSWARAINPSSTTEDVYARSNAALQDPALAEAGGEQQQQLRKGLIGEAPVDSGGYC